MRVDAGGLAALALVEAAVEEDVLPGALQVVAGTGDGLDRFDARTERFATYKLEPQSSLLILALIEDIAQQDSATCLWGQPLESAKVDMLESVGEIGMAH